MTRHHDRMEGHVRQPLDLWGQRGWHGQEVAGESHYADAIRKLLGTASSEWTEVQANAQLIPEKNNRHDPNAVQVKINGAVVGYLPREDAAQYAGVLSRLLAEGWLPQVSARVRGANVADYDYDRRGRIVEKTRFVGSVTLDLAPPHLLVPANLPPDEEHVLLPRGSAIQVTGEEAYLSTLAPLVGNAGECWIHVTLHEVVVQLARTTRNILEVRVDGNPVGRLTPKMSGELLPAVRHFAEHGLLTVARALLKGNQLKADVVLYAAKAGELSAEWLASARVADGSPHQRDTSGVAFEEAAASPGKADLGSEVTTPTPTPTSWKFNPPPGWPEPPPGWTPPPGWAIPPGMPPAPDGWQWWLPVHDNVSN